MKKVREEGAVKNEGKEAERKKRRKERTKKRTEMTSVKVGRLGKGENGNVQEN